MFKLFKYTVFSFMAFMGLYLFGDFRINDVHVKTYLRQNVNWRTITAAKDKVVRFYTIVTDAYDQISDPASGASGSGKNPYRKSLKQSVDDLPLDAISAKDRKAIKDVLKNNF